MWFFAGLHCGKLINTRNWRSLAIRLNGWCHRVEVIVWLSGWCRVIWSSELCGVEKGGVDLLRFSVKSALGSRWWQFVDAVSIFMRWEVTPTLLCAWLALEMVGRDHYMFIRAVASSWCENRGTYWTIGRPINFKFVSELQGFFIHTFFPHIVPGLYLTYRLSPSFIVISFREQTFSRWSFRVHHIHQNGVGQLIPEKSWVAFLV